MTILKIHGCSGAGKTTFARSLIEAAATIDPLHEINNKRKTVGYRLDLLELDNPVFLLGSYENACGGVDTVGTAQEVMEMIDRYAKEGHVVHEGLLQSTYYGAMGEHSKKYGGDYIYAFLDTPINVCLDRVVERRATNESKNKFNPQLTRNKWTTINRLRDRLLLEKEHKVAILNYEKLPLAQLLQLLEPR
jgi:adenylate kinase family enzyme